MKKIIPLGHGLRRLGGWEVHVRSEGIQLKAVFYKTGGGLSLLWDPDPESMETLKKITELS